LNKPAPLDAGFNDLGTTLLLDCDGDGDKDIVLASNVNPSGIGVLRNTDGKGAFVPDSKAWISGAPTITTFASFKNGMGGYDLIALSGTKLFKMTANGKCAWDSLFSSPMEMSTKGYDVAVTFADMDSLPDFVATTGTGVFVRFSAEMGSSIQKTIQGDPRGIAVGDLNGDGNANDLAIANTNGVVNYLMVTPPSIADAKEIKSDNNEPLLKSPQHVAVAELDGKTPDDIVVVGGELGGSTSAVVVLLNQSTKEVTKFAPSKAVLLGPAGTVGTPVGLALHDMDADGDRDIVVLSSRATTGFLPSFSVLLNDGKGNFALAGKDVMGTLVDPPSPVQVDKNPSVQLVGEVTGDSATDVLVGYSVDPARFTFFKSNP
jgi:hypothetical protein